MSALSHRATPHGQAAAPTIAGLLAAATQRLGGHSDSPRLDAEVLLARVLEKPRSFLLAWPEKHIDRHCMADYEALIARRMDGEPVAYLTGRKEFWSLQLRVDRHTLIPRPETEHLVEAALTWLPADRPCRVADLGTGSGAIALALAWERRHWRITACDKSPEALATARRNATELGLDNVECRQGDWCAALEDGGQFDLIAANPPYIRNGDPRLDEAVLRFEPRLALIAGDDGLEDLAAIIHQARAHLRPGGRLLLEHGDDQAAAVMTLLDQAGYEEISDQRDYAGRPRLARARWGRP